LGFRWETALCSGPAWNSRPGRGLPQTPCLAQVCCGVSVCCVIGRATTSVVSAHLEMRLEVKPVGAAPGEVVASCNPKKAQTGDVKAFRPTPGTGIPRHGWGLPLAPSHSALTSHTKRRLTYNELSRHSTRARAGTTSRTTPTDL